MLAAYDETTHAEVVLWLRTFFDPVNSRKRRSDRCELDPYRNQTPLEGIRREIPFREDPKSVSILDAVGPELSVQREDLQNSPGFLKRHDANVTTKTAYTIEVDTRVAEHWVSSLRVGTIVLRGKHESYERTES